MWLAHSVTNKSRAPGLHSFLEIVYCGFFSRVLRRTNTENIICRLSSFIGEGRLQVSLFTLFQAQMGTWVVPPTTFRMLAG